MTKSNKRLRIHILYQVFHSSTLFIFKKWLLSRLLLKIVCVKCTNYFSALFRDPVWFLWCNIPSLILCMTKKFTLSKMFMQQNINYLFIVWLKSINRISFILTFLSNKNYYLMLQLRDTRQETEDTRHEIRAQRHETGDRGRETRDTRHETR